VPTTGDALENLAVAYVKFGALAPCRYEGPRRRGAELVKAVKAHKAQGAIVCSPSFCDPALLDRPGLLAALEAASIPSIQLQYAENSVDYGSVREQAGTFADAIRLWEAA
jgi:benzoyl-CoA reductase subunit C